MPLESASGGNCGHTLLFSILVFITCCQPGAQFLRQREIKGAVCHLQRGKEVVGHVLLVLKTVDFFGQVTVQVE